MSRIRDPWKVSESKRRRDVYRYYSPNLHGIDLSAVLNASPDTPLPPTGFVPNLSSDRSLTAFAQLAAIRLGVSRALISLIDDSYEYILSECDPDLILGADPLAINDQGLTRKLWLGNVCIPRSKGISEAVLKIDLRDNTPNVVAINDLTKHEIYKTASFVTGGPQWRFYAGVPLMSLDGAVIGALSVFDQKPRHQGLDADMIAILQGLAVTTVSHLETLRVKIAHGRGERMIRGLTSFIEGANELLKPENINNSPRSAIQSSPSTKSASSPQSIQHQVTSSPQPAPVKQVTESSTPSSYLGEESLLSSPTLDVSISQPATLEKAPRVTASRVGKTVLPENLEQPLLNRQKTTTSQLQESILPKNARLLFSRAANVIRETSELEGVVFFDASVAGITGQKSNRSHLPQGQISASVPHTLKNRSSSSSSSESSRSTEQNSEEPNRCQVLGFSSIATSSIAGNAAGAELASLLETDLGNLLNLFPSGKVINFATDHEVATSSDDSRDTLSSTDDNARQPRRSRRSTRAKRLFNALQAVAPGARCLSFMPLFDYNRRRWFACCLCWTTRTERIMSRTTDLIYLKAFGNSVMVELARLDEIESNRAKTAFVASISHELRSPLHGVLGGAEFLQATQLDAFQTAMLHSITTSGRVLLDTINHVLDFAKINELNGPATSITRLGDQTINILSKSSKRSTRSADDISSIFNLAIVTEEVVESVFAGQSYRIANSRMLDDQSAPAADKHGASYLSNVISSERNSQRKLVLIVLDISEDADWKVNMPAGAWRRIIMNLFGNSLKYTPTGYIKVGLGIDKNPKTSQSSCVNVTLTITDSGIGMSRDFLANRVYTPFSQEDSFSSGIGLGLSIVRQIVESLDGNLDLVSHQGEGTTVSVNLSMPNAKDPRPKPKDTESVAKVARRMRGRRIIILHKSSEEDPRYAFRTVNDSKGAELFAESLSATLIKWFGMTPVVTDKWTGHNADIVFCTEPSFDYLASIRKAIPPGGKGPITLFLTIDAIEAAALRNDARVTSQESVVEITSQPLGPHKLAKIMDHCFSRYHSQEHLSSSSAASTSGDDSSSWSGSDTVADGERPELQELYGETVLHRAVKPHLQKIREIGVLIVDDSMLNRRLLTALMKKHRLKYREAVNGLDALIKYKESPTEFDFILMDLSMPQMDGMTSTRHIRSFENQEGLPRTHIVALTGLASASARLEAHESGVTSYMTKPVQFAQLIRLFGIYAEEETSSTTTTPTGTMDTPTMSREASIPEVPLDKGKNVSGA